VVRPEEHARVESDWPSVEEAVAVTRARNPSIRALLWTRLDEALVESEARRQEPPRSRLHGVPYGLKDAWDTAGIRTTGGSYRHRHRVPSSSAPIYDVLRDAGAVLLGKSNCSDLSLAPEASSWVGGVTRNPHDPSRTSGGSSGGAAAAVAAGMVGFDWGSDIGGSIRLPAAFCGVYGLRLSSETWPLEGGFPQPPDALRYMNGQGPLATTVERLRAVLEVAAPLRTGSSRPFDLRGVTLYLPKRLGRWPGFVEEVTPVLRAAVGSVEDGHGLPAPERVRDLAGGLWAAHFEELLACDNSCPQSICLTINRDHHSKPVVHDNPISCIIKP